MTSLIGDFKKAGAAAGAASTLGSLLPQKVSPKKLLASTIGAATFQAALPQLALPRAQSDGPADLEQEKLSLPPVNMGSTGTFVSDSDPSLANTSSEKGFMAASQPAPTAQSKWKMMAAKKDMASTQPGESQARRAMNLLMKSNDEKAIEENVEKFAQKLVDTFGSLSAAFKELDQHDREEITRSQWDAALNARGWNTEEMCGLPAAKIFSLVCRASKKPTGALTLPAWKSFFQKYLNRTAAHLPTEERPIDAGVSDMLQKFKAPNAGGEGGKPASDTTSADGIYGQRRGAFIMRPPEELAKLQESQDTDSDDENQDGPSPAGSNRDRDPHGANAGANADEGGRGAGDGRRAAGNGAGEAGEDDATRRGGAGGALSGDAGTEGRAGRKGLGDAVSGDDRHGVGAGAYGAHGAHGAHGAGLSHGVSGDAGKDGPDDGRSRFGDIDLDLLSAGSQSHLSDPNAPRDGARDARDGRDAHDSRDGRDGGDAQVGLGGVVGSRVARGEGKSGGPHGGAEDASLQGDRAGASSAFHDPQAGANEKRDVDWDKNLGHGTDGLSAAGTKPKPADESGLADHATDGLSVPNPDAVPAVSDAVSAGGTTGLGNDLLSTGRENVVGLLDDEEDELDSEEPQGKADDFQSIVKQVFRLYATGYSKGRYVFIRNPDLSRFMEDSRHMIPERIFEPLFDDTIQLQCDMPGQGVRITAGLTLDWFQVFVQKVVRRVGMEVMSFFAALLESQLY